jgi:class 3 adenylate cyclase
MSKSSNETSFMVYTLKGKQWELYATYEAGKKNQAMKDAKALAGISTIGGVKAVQEQLISGSTNTREKILFIDEKQSGKEKEEPKKPKKTNIPSLGGHDKKPQEKKPASISSSASSSKAKISRDDEEDEEPTIYTFSQYLTRFFGIIFFGVAAGVVAAWITSLWLAETGLDPTYQTYVLVGIFFLGFFLVITAAMPMISSAHAAKNTYIPSQSTSVQSQANEPVLEEAYSDFRSQASRMSDLEGDDEAEEKPSVLKEQKSFVLSYLRSALKIANIEKHTLDNFNKFGITMFMGGACDALSAANNLNTETAAQVLSETVKFIGLNESEADSFSDKIQSYLLDDPKYMTAFESGRQAMKIHLRNNASGFTDFKKALDEWNKPKEKEEEQNSPVTVLFTDIAGSTHLTQTQGDEIAQKVVRIHNQIVRAALSKFSGKEIKHTGDGIMASFSNTSNGVAAAMDMQKDTAKHNVANPGLKLGLKIGLNIGQPIVEENDLYGSTVQLAARIVDKAQEAQIFVSETVHGLCSGKNFKFEKRGPFEMKGFENGLNLHELIWDPNAVKSEAVPEKGEAEEAIKPSAVVLEQGEELKSIDQKADVAVDDKDAKGIETKGIEVKDKEIKGLETKAEETDKEAVTPDEETSENSSEEVTENATEETDINTDISTDEDVVLFHADIAGYEGLHSEKNKSSTARVVGALEYAVETIKAKNAVIVRQDKGLILSVFSNPLDATKAAVTVLKKLHELNSKMSKKRQVHFRISVLFGKASQNYSKVSDNAMDEAASLSTNAEPGGLCVSADIVEQLGNKTEITFEKGTDEPEPLYRWQPD